ncbi:DNA internalization-related competence protein ComEC/Rec2 [Alkalihalobacillus sp. MEB130]|uniref:DNA internalization-related competence protein ComEC/Rec2 n=1 Tax=Alkalihalobacillus sp. MEB130 TaxID=2976704 RepID=UPI0028DE2608|nr:DNA internalization-related competence protein ComEC/Rec2 [Alkalihalobacillus sp. MEB130]MDT8861430.1 DNA internalization-related competence protein ComEC/Rec2 [Alkalihalobacillus sp. MEB130]
MRSIFPLFTILPAAATLGLLLALKGADPPYLIVLTICLTVFFYQRMAFKMKILLFTIPFLLYYFVGLSALDQQKSVYTSGEQTVIGTIHTNPIVDGDSLSMRVKSDKNEVIQIQLFLSNEQEQHQMKRLMIGDVCKINGTFTSPSPATNFHQFNYRQYLYEQQIFWIVRPNIGGIQCYESENQSNFIKLQKWRDKQLNRMELDINPELHGIMSALVFGERGLMEGDVLYAYQKLGIIHLLAVSGLHVGMIVTALFYCLIRIGMTRERTMELLLIFLPIYIIVAGAAPSVVRASLMAIIVLLFLRLKLKIPPLLGIVIVYLGYLLVKPYIIFQLGFQLSFLVSFGLIVSAPTLQARYNQVHLQLLFVTILSQFLSFPILLHYMFEFSVISIPLNLVYIPFISFCVLPLTFLAFLASFILPATYNVPLIFLEKMVPSIHDILILISEQKWSTFITGRPSSIIMIFLYVGVVFALLKWEKGGALWWRQPAIVLGIVMIVHLGAPYIDSRAKITMIDVGQGDSFLLELPYRRAVYLIDTGGTVSFFQDEAWRQRRRSFEVGANIVAPALKARGIRTIDSLLLSHGHLDHIGGAEALVDAFTIREVLYSKGPVENAVEHDLLHALAKKGANIQFVSEGVNWKEGGAQFIVLSPVGDEMNLNARSIVLHVIVEGISFLFTGDLEEEGERRLIQTYPGLQVDILKAGHHGSRTSTTEQFLEQLQPKAIFISAGRNNRFGHPHPDVMNRLEERNVVIWRTDQHGSVQLLLRNGQIEASSMIQEK